MLDTLFYIAIFLGFLALLPFVLGPVLIYLKQEMPARPEFFSLTDAEIESCTAPEFLRRTEAMYSLGFEQVANLQWILTQSRTYTRIFYRRETQELANVTEITTSAGDLAPPISLHYMEFTTEYDAVEVNTNNSSTQAVYAPVPQKQIHYLPGLTDARVLYNVHRHVTRTIEGELKPLPPPNSIEQQIQMDSMKTQERQVETGYLYLDAARATYRPTVKGAILMTWKLVWPVGPIRTWHVRRKARRLLSEASA